MTSRTTLTSGASIAGPALACWLRRYGPDPAIIERAPRLRVGGQNIDVRGAGREVARRMGVEDAIRAANTGEQGTRFIGGDGRVIAEFAAGTSDTTTRGHEQRSTDDQFDLLRTVFSGAGWETDRVLSAMTAAPDFTFERVAQVHAPRWSTGRIALVGNAAYCASRSAAWGPCLALTGASVLAGELAAHHHHQDAFRGHERIMRPYVDRAQKLPPGVPRSRTPRTRLGIAAFHAGPHRSHPDRRQGHRRSLPATADEIDLPDYGQLETNRHDER